MTSERFHRRFSLGRAIFWVALIFIAYFVGWLGAVTFVSICSLYANAASDFAAYRADDNPALKRLEEKLDRVIEQLQS